MTEFCSFFVFRPDEIDLIHSISDTAKWITRDIPDPSMRYAFFGRGMRELSQASALKDMGAHNEGQQGGKLLLLETEQAEANNIIQLICAANVVLEGFPFVENPPTCGFELSEDEADRRITFENVFQRDGVFQCFTYRDTLPVAVALAAKAWQDKKLIYAIHKLARSYETESVTPWSMHPRNEQVFEKHTDDFASHVGSSVAINLAYSAIEELGLRVQGSKEKPRFLPKGSNTWNPAVLKPFLKRLQENNIEEGATFDWITRGSETELQDFAGVGELSNFSNGEEIRDRTVSLPYAIQFCEYLRNMMTAHSFEETTARLGPYEVYNCQSVARFLLLKRCEMFDVCAEDLKCRF